MKTLYLGAKNMDEWEEHIAQLLKSGELYQKDGEIDWEAVFDFPIEPEMITYKEFKRRYPNKK